MRADSRVVSVFVFVFMLAAGPAVLSAQLKPLGRPPTGRQLPAPRALKALPMVALEGPVQAGGELVLRIENVSASGKGFRVKLARASDGKVVFLKVKKWTTTQVVAAVPDAPFERDVRRAEVLVGLCDGSNHWVGVPSRAVFEPLSGTRVGRRPAGCANPDWDGDGVNASECGGSDCDDGDGRRYPGGVEVCDIADVDEDCDARTFGTRDADGDGMVDAACCNRDAAGGRLCGTDCDDHQPGVHRTAPEVCDGRDNDCDGSIDEGVQLILWADADGDGFGDPHAERRACGWAPGLSYVNNDCNDRDPRVFKGKGCE